MRSNPCKLCGSEWHTKFTCSWRKGKPLRPESAKTFQKRQAVRKAWFAANPPDAQGFWRCYISKHPNCPKLLTESTVTLEHDLAKVRRPDLKFDIANIYPACSWDNQAKGSKSAQEYMSQP